MNALIRTIAILVIILLLQSFLLAQDPKLVSENPEIVVKAIRLDAPIVLDGALSEPFWKDENAVTNFTQRDPVEGAAPSERTIVDIAYDDQAIYIGARMYDSQPALIEARLARKDVDVTSDRFIFYIDSYHDRRTGFYFGLNAAGTQYDGTLLNDNWDDNTWDGVWEGKAKVDEKGWTAEMRIPYSQLRFEKEDKYTWGVNFKRHIARKNEDVYLAYKPKDGTGFVSRFPDISGLENIAPPRRLAILPYVSSQAEYSTPEPGDPFQDGSSFGFGAGADLKMGLGTNLTLDATVNPDFGQVEVDPAVINLGDVETFYPEKRPFFIEGSNIFNFGEGGATNYWGFNWASPQFFYSRRIGRAPQGSVPDDADFTEVPIGTSIIGAAKLTGKLAGSWNVGVLNAFTAQEDALVDQVGLVQEIVVEPMTYYGVYRAQKEIAEGRQGIGFISTLATRKFNEEYVRDEFNDTSFTVGLDGWTFLDADKTWVIAGWSGISRITGNETRISDVQQDSRHYLQRPDVDHVSFDPTRTSLTGFAGRVLLNKEKGNFLLNSAIGMVNPTFDVNDVGFQFRSDQINGHFMAGYKWTEPGRFTRFVELGAAGFQTIDFGATTTWSGVFHYGYVQFLNYYSIDYSFAYNPETTSNTRTRGGPQSLNPRGWEYNFLLNSDSRRSWVYGVGAYGYTSDDFWNRGFNATLEWKPASNISISVAPNYEISRQGAQYIDTFVDPLATHTYGSRYVFSLLDQKTVSASLRLNWTFSPKLSLQLYGQPLISSGNYTDFKELTRRKTFNFNHYGQGTLVDGVYTFDPDGTGPAQSISFDDPNFNVRSLRGNAILRWEYRPGSTIYFVWTQTKSDEENIGDFQFANSVNKLWQAETDNVFLIKFTYYWNP
jgi:Domain of unknown function (DUF5916)